jgi:hypothetical protein
MKEEGECGRMRGKKRQMSNKEWHRHTVTNVEYKALLLPPPPPPPPPLQQQQQFLYKPSFSKWGFVLPTDGGVETLVESGFVCMSY